MVIVIDAESAAPPALRADSAAVVSVDVLDVIAACHDGESLVL